MAVPWVILRRHLCLVPKEAEAEHPSAISVELRQAPRVTVLDVSPSVHRPGPIRSGELPYLVATGPSAVLFGFSDAEDPVDTDDLFLERNFVSPEDPSRQPTTATAELVPRRTGPSMPATYNVRTVGLTAAIFGGYVITELRVTDSAKLLRLSSSDDRFFPKERLFSSDHQWVETYLPYPLPTRTREWSPSGVVEYNKKLWWFDLSWGLLSCDPEAVDPVVLSFHDLPPGGYVNEATPLIHTTRSICVSDRRLRYVDISENKVVMWTWGPEVGDSDGSDDSDSNGNGSGGDSNGSDGDIGWHQTYEMSFEEIWSDASYRETQLPPMIPQIVLVSPRSPSVVYFFLLRSLFFVDVPAHRVVGVVRDARKLVVAPGRKRCVLPWNLTPSIGNGIVEDVIPSEGDCRSSSTISVASD